MEQIEGLNAKINKLQLKAREQKIASSPLSEINPDSTPMKR